jgi:hypothetical protein
MAAVAGMLTAWLSVPTASAGASTAYSGGGFDTCAAPSVSQMSAWMASPYRSVGIYIGGVNRACGDGNLSASWVSSVEGQGWSLLPLYVGLQAPCVSQAGLATIDPTVAGYEGVAAADDAAARAANFGLPPGSPIYFDMEGYATSASCSATVELFLSGWTTELHNMGYISGVYGSSASTIADQAGIYQNPGYDHADDIWFADWNGCPSNVDPYFSNAFWSGYQRVHQYMANSAETWGGVTIDIDRDYVDGAVAGPGGTGSNASPSCATGAGWTPWTQLAAAPAGVAGAPAVASWGPGRLDLFVQGGNHMLYHAWSVNSGSSYLGWQSLGAPPGGIVGSPAAVSWGPNRIDVFARGANNALWHTWWDGLHWKGWEELGGSLLSAPTVTSWSAGRLDVFVVGAQHQMYHLWYAGNWRGFEALGGYCLQDPGAASWGPNRIDLFTLGSHSNLFHMFWNGTGWSAWLQESPGYWFSGPAAASAGPGQVDVFLESSAAGRPMGHAYWAPGWFEDSEGGTLTSSPTAVSLQQQLYVFVRGLNGGLWQTHN